MLQAHTLMKYAAHANGIDRPHAMPNTQIKFKTRTVTNLFY